MNTHELAKEPEDVEISNLRTRIQEAVESREGEDSYSKRLSEAFEWVEFYVARTVGKIEGGDIINAEEISPEDLATLKEKLDEFRKLLL